MSIMRRLTYLTFISYLFVFSSPPAHAQEPGKIVDQYVKAAGGSKALGKIQTLTLEGAFTNCDGKGGTYTLDTKLPNRFY